VKGRLEPSWYVSVLAPIANPWVGREGMPVDDGGGNGERRMYDGSRSHVDLIIKQVECVYSPSLPPHIKSYSLEYIQTTGNKKVMYLYVCRVQTDQSAHLQTS
jgi:hypothetical protein